MKKVFWVSLFFVVSFNVFANESLDNLINIAMKENQKLKALEHSIKSLESRISEASAWKNPNFGVEYSNVPINSWKLGDHSMSGIGLKLSQTFPFPGKTSKRKSIAKKNVEEGELKLLEEKSRLRGIIKIAYFKLYLIKELKKITEKHIALSNQFIDITSAKYRVGKAPQHNFLQLSVLRDQLKDDLADFDKEIEKLIASINAVLHRDTKMKIAFPEKIIGNKPKFDFDFLLKVAKKNRPLLLAWEKHFQSEKLTANLYSFEAWPDISFWMGYRIRKEIAGTDEGTDQMLIGLSFPIPLFYKSNVSSKKTSHLFLSRKAKFEYNALLDEIKGDLEASLISWNRAFNKTKNYEDNLIPKAKKTLDAVVNEYKVGKTDFANLYQAQILLLTFDKIVQKANAEALILEAKVETLVGKAVEAL